MCYRFGLVPVTDSNLQKFVLLYREHYGQQVKSADEVCVLLNKFFEEGVLAYFACVMLISGEPVAAMGILEYPYNDEGKEFVFTHLVTHTNWRSKGFARQCIVSGTKMLLVLNPKRIRNHKRMNVIPQRYFHELGFVEKKVTIPDMPEYKYRYTLECK